MRAHSAFHSFLFACSALLLMLGMSSGRQALAQDQTNPEPKEGGNKKAAEGAKPQGQRRGQQGRGNRRGGPGGRRGMRGNFDPQQMVEQRLNQTLGKDRPVDLKALPYGAATRLVNEVPVGGVDSHFDRQKPWSMEEVFTVDDAKKKELEGLRKAYEDELASQRKKIEAFNKEAAVAIATLRRQYEEKANAILGEEARAEKKKLDELAASFSEERAKKLEGFTEKSDTLKTELTQKLKENEGNNNFAAMREVFTKMREFTTEVQEAEGKLAEAYRGKMKESVTGEAKTKLEGLLEKQNAEAQRRAERRQNRGGDRRGGGDRAPKPPPQEESKTTENF